MEYKKQKHGYEKFHMYDMYASTVSEVEFEFSIEEAKQIILEALKPLGEQYLEYVKQCFDERWIDLIQEMVKEVVLIQVVRMIQDHIY